MNDRFEDLRTFVTVVQAQSFKGAADRLGLVKSAVSRRVRDLEDRLGVQLIYRTTRALRPTDVGNDLYWRGVAILSSLQEAEQIASYSSDPAGRLKVSAPTYFVNLVLAPVVGEFIARNPRVTLEVRTNDGAVDLLAEGLDVAIVRGPLRDSRLTVRKLCDVTLLLVAAPAYWDLNGRPDADAHLTDHGCVLHAHRPFQLAGVAREASRARLGARITFDNDEAIRAAVLAGAGVAQLPTVTVREDLKNRSLEALAGDEVVDCLRVVYPSGTPPRKTRAFVDFVVALSSRVLAPESDTLSRRSRSATGGQDGEQD